MQDLDENRLNTYLNTLMPICDKGLIAVEREALAADIPIIRKDMQFFLRWLLAQRKPMRILEIGTAVGFSALFMARYSKATIDTIENYPPRLAVAKENFKTYAPPGRIVLMEGDAAEILPTLEADYDLVFMDAAKGQYLSFFEEVRPRIKKDGVLLVDNVLREGDILESRFVITRRNRTIHKRMREFLRVLTEDEDYVTDILPIGDGIAVATKVR